MAGLSDLRVAIIGGAAVMGLMFVLGMWVVVVATRRFGNSFCGAADNYTSHGRTQDHDKVGNSGAGLHRFDPNGALLENVVGASNIYFGAPLPC
jgi:hypothetical protein